VAGIGSATALTFAREGAKLIMADMHGDGGRPTGHLLKENGGEAIFVKIEPHSSLRKMLLSPLIFLTTAACAGTMERTWTKVPVLVFVAPENDVRIQAAREAVDCRNRTILTVKRLCC
jgi:NAD(P)-dependent dehydrogenase (short-subunit alcohol dehydrogenase family)